MIAALNQLVELVEKAGAEEVDVATVAAAHGSTEYHLRRMFSSLAGVPGRARDQPGRRPS